MNTKLDKTYTRAQAAQGHRRGANLTKLEALRKDCPKSAWPKYWRKYTTSKPYQYTPEGTKETRFVFDSKDHIEDYTGGTAEYVDVNKSPIAGRSLVDHKGWYSDAFEVETYRGFILVTPWRNKQGDRIVFSGYVCSMSGQVTAERDKVSPEEQEGEAYLTDCCIWSELVELIYAADKMAEIEAKKERYHNIKWQAENLAQELEAEAQEDRRLAKELAKDTRRMVQDNGATLWQNTDKPEYACNVLKSVMQQIRAHRQEAQSKLEKAFKAREGAEYAYGSRHNKELNTYAFSDFQIVEL